MDIQLPQHLFCNEILANKINKNTCVSCTLLRRSKYIELPTKELDSSIWSSKDIFGLSINISLCNIDSLDIKSKPGDVRIVSSDERNVNFVNNDQREGIDISEVKAFRDNKIILKMILGKIANLNGSYPFGQVGSEDYQEYEYKLSIKFKPLLFNPFHFEIDVLSSEDNFTVPLDRNKLKGYQKSLASDIRNRILLEKLISPH